MRIAVSDQVILRPFVFSGAGICTEQDTGIVVLFRRAFFNDIVVSAYEKPGGNTVFESQTFKFPIAASQDQAGSRALDR